MTVDAPDGGADPHLATSLAAVLQSAPAPRGSRGATLLMFSGGLDSVALLAGLLRETDHEIHAHHIDLHNVEERGRAESDAIRQVLPYLWEHYRDFEYSSSKSVFHLGWGGYDITLAMFFAARVHLTLGHRFDYVITGHRSPGTSEAEFSEAAAVFQACFVNGGFEPAWLTPLSGVDKAATLASIPGDLAALSWSCRRPVVDGAGSYRRCGECHACRALDEVEP